MKNEEEEDEDKMTSPFLEQFHAFQMFFFLRLSE